MNYPLQKLIQMGILPAVALPPNSRYYGSNVLTYTGADGQTVSYLERRFVPQPGTQNNSKVAQHVVKQGDRLDLIAAKYLGDPLVFWLICDANGAIDPSSLLDTPGQIIEIAMPQGVPGVSSGH